MKRVITVLAVTAAISLAAAGTALADPPVQSATQSSATGQTAVAGSSTTQTQPSNQNISVRVLSPGDDGSVTQSNTASSAASATNSASTTQQALQSAAAACGCLSAGAPVQASQQSASTTQGAGATSSTEQVAPSNSNVSVRVLSPGSNGRTTQSNTATSTGTAANTAPTTQTTGQAGGGSGVQAATQAADTTQAALAGSTTKQVDPSNSTVSVRVLSPGGNGNVSQSNTATSQADARNAAPVSQTATQTGQGGCGCSGSGVQFAGQSADVGQLAAGLSGTTQTAAGNDSSPAGVGSYGSGGKVEQSNDAASTAAAANTAPVTQSAGQAGGGIQAVEQGSGVEQAALAGSATKQTDPSNSAGATRIGSHGSDGSVTQANDATSTATATNTAAPKQTATQTDKGGCGCSGSGVQSVDQWSHVGQLAGSISGTTQTGASNDGSPIRVDSPGSGGKVEQSNDAASTATAANTAPVTQSATQAGGGIQAVEQGSGVEQAALAGSATKQTDPSNSADATRIGSHGSDGSVSQANDAASTARATNDARPTQTAAQSGASHCGCSGSGLEYAGQSSYVGQLAGSLSGTTQTGASNDSSPIRVGSSGSGGKVEQSNDAASTATAANTAPVTQSATQAGGGIQVIGQGSHVGQAALAGSATKQTDPSNTADPVRIGSHGSDGSVNQANDASSTARAANDARPTQTATETDKGGCGCSGAAVQAAGQSSYVGQLAGSLSGTTQAGASNDSSPIRVDSPGSGGNVEQSNDAASTADARNNASVMQAANLAGAGIQAVGQKSDVGQAALAGSSTAQLGGRRSKCGCGGSSSGNIASPVRIGSGGNDGSVRQSNDGTSHATASNSASTVQAATLLANERCGCHGAGVQALGQESGVEQLAYAPSWVIQSGAANAADPTRVWSGGGSGRTAQSNDAASEAAGSNRAPTMQTGRLLM